MQRLLGDIRDTGKAADVTAHLIAQHANRIPDLVIKIPEGIHFNPSSNLIEFRAPPIKKMAVLKAP